MTKTTKTTKTMLMGRVALERQARWEAMFRQRNAALRAGDEARAAALLASMEAFDAELARQPAGVKS